MKYTFTCSQGHEPFTASVEAENDDEAMEKMTAELKPHMDEKHPDFAGKSEDELKEMITSNWTKEEAGEAPAAEESAA